MKIYFASDHTGFPLKKILLDYVRDELGHEVEDCGAFAQDENDDYPDFVKSAAEQVSQNPDNFAIVLGGTGEGEAMVANRIRGVRAAVYYGGIEVQPDISGDDLSIVEAARAHNTANVLSLGARVLNETSAKAAVKTFLETPFAGEERHLRRLKKIDDL